MKAINVPVKVQIQFKNVLKKRKCLQITYTKTPTKSILKTQEKFGCKCGRKFAKTVRFKQNIKN